MVLIQQNDIYYYYYSYHESGFLSNIYIKVNRLFTQVNFFKKTSQSFFYILNNHGTAALKERVEFFYTSYLQTLNFGKQDLLDVYQGYLLTWEKNMDTEEEDILVAIYIDLINMVNAFFVIYRSNLRGIYQPSNRLVFSTGTYDKQLISEIFCFSRRLC